MNEPAPRDQLGREETIFNAAVQLRDAAKRAIYLDLACEDEPLLRGRIEKLLASDADDNFFAQRLSPPVQPPCAGPVGEGCPPAATEPHEVSERIGRYKLLQKIGEGGCGVVYMAEQEQPVRRRVALKIIRLGMDTQSVIARFEAERQALALMDHPNIAKILDGGVTETGRPYFVMDLVQGLPLTQFCDEAQLPTRERLGLFLEVCSAIQHAHQKGIIHRDIKPSNILVTLHGEKPVPKVIDFGIAKATQQRLTDKTLFTQFQHFIGTPAYMSPEQATLSGLDIDTRSDIYSLGVLLYELLTGKTPLDSKELVQAGLEEMCRTIREKEPARPSTRLSTLAEDELTTTAKRRGLVPPKLISLLRGDLDWIVMKCLEKDRARRYETANGLAMDLQRHLKNEPVVARPPGRFYRLRKLVRRNRLLFVATGAVALALVLGLGLSTWLFLRERAGKREQAGLRQQAQTAQASEARERAKAEMELANRNQVAQLLKEMLQGVGPSKARGRDTAMLKEILDKTAERIGHDLTNRPEVEIEIRTTLADVYQELGLFKEMEAMATANLELARVHFGQESAATGEALLQLGAAQLRLAKFDQSEETLRKSLTLRRKLLGKEHVDVAEALNTLALALQRKGKASESESCLREALAMLKKLKGEEDASVAGVLCDLADLLREQGKYPEAEATSRQGLEMLKQVLGPDHPDVATALHNLAMVVEDQGKFPQAEFLARQALELRRRVLAPEHPDLAESLLLLGDDLLAEGKATEAEPFCREALAIERKVLGNNHNKVAISLGTLGEVLRAEQKLPEAESTFRQALDVLERLFGHEHMHVATVLNDLGLVLASEGKLAEAEAMLRQVPPLYRKLLGDEHPYVASSLTSLAYVLGQEDKLTEAEPLVRESLAMWRKVSNEHPNVATSLQTLAINLRQQGRLPEAETAAREALALRRKVLGNEHPRVGDSLGALANILSDEGKYADAEALYREGLDIARKREGNEHPDVAIALSALALTLMDETKLAEGEASAREALATSRKAGGDAHPEALRAVGILASILEQERRFTEAEALCTDFLLKVRGTVPADDPQLAGALAQAASTFLGAQKFAQAEAPARESLDIRARKSPQDWLTCNSRALLGASLLGQKRYSDSEPLLLSAGEEMERRKNRIPSRSKSRVRETLSHLVELYEATSRPDQAAQWKQKLADFDATQIAKSDATATRGKPPP